MVHIIYEWYTQSLTEREKVSRREQPVVVLQSKEPARIGSQSIDSSFQSLERGSRPSGKPTTMQGERLCTDHPCYGCLVLELRDRRGDNTVRFRIEHHELVRMKAEPDSMVPGGTGRFHQFPADFCPLRKVCGFVSTRWMGCERHELARGPEGTDSELTAPLDGIDQSVRVGEHDLRQVSPAFLRRQRGAVSMSCLTELDG
jgi:hypothetical protein